MNNFKKSKPAIFNDGLQKTELDANILEFSHTIEDYINIVQLIKNLNVNYLHNKSETLAYMEDFIHVMNVGTAILNSILDGLKSNNTSILKNSGQKPEIS